jgi:hypothetical protein
MVEGRGKWFEGYVRCGELSRGCFQESIRGYTRGSGVRRSVRWSRNIFMVSSRL